ncbi:hypothetical protein COLO4_20504 [Corchorus olitorius]|uniref:Terpene synthase metal-binding domain-containing protein n=1 Tax=Corchorus olitorius TaxID=93759 RepID=A0A1R3IZL3_9ROSI|nr:hypothetical protein COLO4_20504 [Corchorus olitorius]
MVSGCSRMAFAQIMIGMEEADKNVYEWFLNTDNKITKSLQISSRLYNDIVTNEDEDRRGFSTAWTCYMKQHNVSRNEAVKAFREKLAAAWKVINEGYCMRPTPVPRAILRAALNYQRMLDFAYKYNDDYTKPEIAFKHLIPKVLLHPIPI